MINQLTITIFASIILAILLITVVIFKIKKIIPKKISVDLLVTNGTVLTMNKQKEIIPNGAVAIRDENIIEVGTVKTLHQKYTAKQVINTHGNVIMPGIINAHTHTPMTLFRGLADDLSLKGWIQKYIFPLEKKYIKPDFVYWGTKLACYEMIKGGTTTFVNMYFFENFVAQAAYDIGMRAIVGQTIMGHPTPDSSTYKEALEHAQALVKKWKNNPLITPAIAPHAPYSCSKEILLASKNFSEKYNTPLIIHISETKQEVEKIKKQHNMRSVIYLDSLGMLNEKMIAAHCVHINNREIELLAEKKVGIVHCPVSNMKLSSGIAPIYDLLKQGALVGLGTDGAASNNSLDMFGEMKTATLLQKVATENPQTLNAYQTLELATIGGARAIHMEDKIGSLEAGKKADIITVAINKIHQIPVYNIISQLVYASKATDVQTVIINGKLIMKDRNIGTKAEQKELRKKVEQFRKAIAKEEN